MHLVPALPLLFAATLLGAAGPEDPAPKRATESCSQGHRHAFGGSVQVLAPLKDLKTALDERTGLGIGLQWIHEGRGRWASRTRLEWNVFSESNPVGPLGVETSVKQYLLSFDRLYRLGEGSRSLYLLGGVGGARWFVDQQALGTEQGFHTTKLAITGGAGWRFSHAFGLEARYVVSGIDRGMDANTAQVSFNWRF